jgi:adenylate kinase
MKRRIALLGPPGSGKGTIAIRLQEEFGFVHVSSGHWLRREIENGTPIGRQVQVFLDKGELVPDELVLSFMEQRLETELQRPGFILDGFPRTLGQAKALDRWLSGRGAGLEMVLFCDCSEPVILDRITGRRVCSRCGRGYHIRGMPPKVAGQCDDCGSSLIQREDDTEPVVRNRLMVYSRLTKPLINYYEQQGKLAVLDATQASNSFYAASVEALKNDHSEK